MTDEAQIEVTVVGSLDQVDATEWDLCACPEAGDGRAIDPFTTYRFLKALEDSGSVGAGTGWEPRHVLARRDGALIGVMPCYAKNHSQGEYIFDFNWAHAYENAGGRYYPKLQVAVPFTPATGRRFLTAAGCDEVGMSALVQGAVQLAAQNELSSIHATFCTEAEALAGAEGLLIARGSSFIGTTMGMRISTGSWLRCHRANAKISAKNGGWHRILTAQSISLPAIRSRQNTGMRFGNFTKTRACANGERPI